MADVKIRNLPPANNVSSTDLFEIETEEGLSKKATLAQVFVHVSEVIGEVIIPEAEAFANAAAQSAIEAANSAVNAADAAALAGQYGEMKIYTEWDDLDAVVGANGDIATVLVDSGTHIDPVTATSVNNSGLYEWNHSVTGWYRVANTSVVDAQVAAAESANSAAQSAISANASANSANLSAYYANLASDYVDLALSIGNNLTLYSSWDDLDLVDGANGEFSLILVDSGSHIDPVSNTSVLNEGLYEWNHSVTDWERIANTSSIDAAYYATLSETSANNSFIDAERSEAAAALAGTYGAMNVYSSWDELSDIIGTANSIATVLIDDGYHIDPVTSANVENTGLYAWSTSPSGWERVDNSSAGNAAESANLALSYANSAAMSANVSEAAASLAGIYANSASESASLAGTYGAMNVYSSWTILDSVPGANGDLAMVLVDSGSHIDPVSNTSVLNEGLYEWNHSVTDWERIANTVTYDAYEASVVATAAANSASTSANTASAAADVAVSASAAAQAYSNYRATFAEGIADFAVGEYFSTAESGELRVYLRIADSPFYEDQGDTSAVLSRSALAAVGGAALVGTASGGTVEADLSSVEDYLPAFGTYIKTVSGIRQGLPVNLAEFLPNTVSLSDILDHTTTQDHGTYINDAIAAILAEREGGEIILPGKLNIETPIILPEHVTLRGINPKQTVLVLPNGSPAGASVIRTRDFTALSGTNAWLVSEGVPVGFGILNMRIDGNKANNPTAGPAIQLYGKRYLVDNVIIDQAAADAFYSECGFKGGQNSWDDMPEALIQRLYIKGPGGAGVRFRGPHDGMMDKVFTAGGTVGVSFEAEVGQYLGVCDVGFIHAYAALGPGISIGCRVKASHLIGENCKEEGVITQSDSMASGCMIDRIEAYGNNRTTPASGAAPGAKFHVMLGAGNCQINSIWVREDYESAGGLDIAGQNNTIGSVALNGNGKNYHAGIGLRNRANGTQVASGVIRLWRNTDSTSVLGGTALETNSGSGHRRVSLNLRLIDSHVLWKNASNSAGDNIMRISGGDIAETDGAGVTLYDGAGTLNATDSLDVVLRDAVNNFKLSSAQGVATVASGNTSVAVTHGLIQAPHSGGISITPNANLEGASFWYSGVGATQFSINLSAAPASNKLMAWQAKVGR